MIAEHKWQMISHKVEWPSSILKTKSEAKLSEEAYGRKKAKTARKTYE